MPVFTTHYIQEETEKYGAKYIDDFFNHGDEDNGFMQLNLALQESASFPEWNAFFKGEYEGYKNKDYKSQEKGGFNLQVQHPQS